MNHYISIECEVGSNGAEIAKGVAESLSLPCYGSDVLAMVAEEHGFTKYDMKNYMDTIADSFMFSYCVINQVRSNQNTGLPQEGMIYAEQRKKIKELAKKGNAVFVGQCAVEAIREFGSVTRVFIKADEFVRQKNMIGKMTNINDRAEDLIKRLDKMQEQYYFCNECKRWRDPGNYDIVLDSEKLGVERCIRAIKQEFIKNKN